MLEYIMTNYTWFLGGIIIIFLAIIGYFADKTNFGQGKSLEKNQKPLDNNFEDKTLQEVVNNKFKEENVNGEKTQQTEVLSDEEETKEEIQQTKPLSNDEVVQQTEDINSDNAEEIQETTLSEEKIVDKPLEETQINVESEGRSNFEDSFAKFDKEFEELLPKKEIIEDEFLDDIDNLKLDKTQKIDLGDIPDFDDVDLPKIKKMESETEDVWKF